MKILMIDDNISQDAISYYISKHQVKCQDSPIVPWFIVKFRTWMHNKIPQSLHLIHKKTVSKMALKIPLHFKWAFPHSSKRIALGWTRPRHKKHLSGGLDILWESSAIHWFWLTAVAPQERGALSCHAGKLQGRWVVEESTPVSSSCCSAPHLIQSYL